MGYTYLMRHRDIADKRWKNSNNQCNSHNNAVQSKIVKPTSKKMPPVLDPSKSKVDGLAFLGLSLARNSEVGHPDSATHQTNFDLNEVLDRDYEFIFSTNDDGWLVGGGEPGPPTTYKLAARDSAHVEIMRIGTYRKDWGGVPQEEIVEVMKSGEILIPQIDVLPTAVVANPDKPPELEIRFDMEPQIPDFEDPEAPLPTNWQLRFLHNQLFKRFIFPSRFCPGAFHSTILRKAEFRSEEHRAGYFQKCDDAINAWRKRGPMPLNEVKRDIEGNPVSADEASPATNSGIWLFTDRENITHFFEPNFLPPYNTPEKRKIILDMLKEEWDEKTLSWKPCGEGSMTKKVEVPVEQEAAPASVIVDLLDSPAEPLLDLTTEPVVQEETVTPATEEAVPETPVVEEVVKEEATEEPAAEAPVEETPVLEEETTPVETPAMEEAVVPEETPVEESTAEPHLEETPVPVETEATEAAPADETPVEPETAPPAPTEATVETPAPIPTTTVPVAPIMVEEEKKADDDDAAVAEAEETDASKPKQVEEGNSLVKKLDNLVGEVLSQANCCSSFTMPESFKTTA